MNNVERHWTNHTIQGRSSWRDSKASADYIHTIDRSYPMYLQLFGLYDEHLNETILDYGCGPGNDLVGYSLYSRCKKIVGADISSKAIAQAIDRLSLHNIQVSKDISGSLPAPPHHQSVSILKIDEEKSEIDCEDDYFDFIQSTGVIHHTSDPEKVLGELYRVLKPGGRLNVMMYHRNSLWVKLVIPNDMYNLQSNISSPVVAVPGSRFNELKSLNSEQIFERLADNGAPVAFLSDKSDFTSLANSVGFTGGFDNAAFSLHDLRACLVLNSSIQHLPEDTLEFVNQLDYDHHDKIQIVISPGSRNNVNVAKNRLYYVQSDDLGDIHIANATMDIDGSQVSLRGEDIQHKLIYTNSDNVTISAERGGEVILTEVYPVIGDEYYPGINAIYKFIK